MIRFLIPLSILIAALYTVIYTLNTKDRKTVGKLVVRFGTVFMAAVAALLVISGLFALADFIH